MENCGASEYTPKNTKSTKFVYKESFQPMNPPMSNVQQIQRIPQQSPTVTPINPNLMTCSSCDAVLDNHQRYCLNCGTRSRFVSNPAIDYVAENRRKNSLLAQPPSDDGIAGTGVTKRALPWLAGSAVIALVAGLLIGSSRGDDNAALLAALADRPAAVAAAPTGPTAAVASVALTSDFTLDKGYTVQVATIPSTSDQAAAAAAKTAATGKGAEDVGLINPADFTLDPDPSGNYVIFSGQFEKKSQAEAALKKLKSKFPDAAVVSVTSTTADTGEGELTEELKDSPLGGNVTKEKVAKDQKAVKELDGKTGEEFVEGQDELPDAIVNDDPANVNGGGPTQ
jgi:hypothetical protein